MGVGFIIYPNRSIIVKPFILIPSINHHIMSFKYSYSYSTIS